jgi:diguanylate cyclase (GGDEF)-like protein
MSEPQNEPWRWLLGRGREQRTRLSQQLFAVALLSACTLILAYAATLSDAPTAWVAAWAVSAIASACGAFALIRSGWSLRFTDPSLTLWQMGTSLAFGALAYPLAGPLRQLVLPILMLILVFGMFQLRRGQALAVAVYGLAVLGAAMLFAQQVWPGNFDPSAELGHFMVAVVCLPGVGILAGRLSRIRHRLVTQREQLNQALARIEELATRDVLTGLYNRRHGEGLLRQALQRRRRTGTSFAVGLIDLDHFKRVNDRYGHAIGDAVLRAFAESAQSTLRGTDTLTRWGGEEFLLLLDDADAAAASIALQRIQGAVAQAAVEAEGQALSFTFSAGVAVHAEGETELLLLDRADRALYQAKSAGRDRVVIS